MNTLKVKGIASFYTAQPVSASEDGTLPSTIEVLKVGMWDTPYHGMFMVTQEDLQEYVDNFAADIRPSSSTQGLPIDLEHDTDGGAYGWMTNLRISPDGMTLLSDVSWTPEGAQLIKDGVYKFFSPEFCPDFYEDPESFGSYFENVLIGGGLTNRPLFKDLKPVTASDKAGETTSGLTGDKLSNTIFIKLGEKSVNLETIRTKAAADLSTDEQRFVADNKDQLTADERAKFGLTASEDEAAAKAKADADAKAAADKVAADAAEAAKTASDKSGTVAVNASEYEALKASAERGNQAFVELETKKASDKVDTHIARGAVKSSQKDSAVSMLMASDKGVRESFEKFLAELPENKLVTAGEKGDGGANTVGGAYAEISKRANDMIKEAKADGRVIEYGVAVNEVSKQDPELAKAYQAEISGK
jgi:hypothetical protein